ncbi:MAG: type IA DNA topoisomerase [Lachnospiraceae bacterium]|nr:type IA DNA topoisomerase [Lachnospiraceae bacterium]
MGKKLYIAEKPSVAQEFAKALKENFRKGDGYNESNDSIVTWCVGHLITMSYPEAYDPALKSWRYDSLPFIPKEFKYEVIDNVAKQFNIVKGLLNRADVDRIYVCTDSGREGEYIYRLVDQMAMVPATKDKRRVWIDSQTEEEILRGIREAKPLTEYNNLSDAAYLRAKEDYLMGINFSRILTLRFGNEVKSFLKVEKPGAISVGRVMTCVLGMVVRREREIRNFVKTPFYRVVAALCSGNANFEGEFRAVQGSAYANDPRMYKENGFKKREDAEELIANLMSKARSELVFENASPVVLADGTSNYTRTATDGTVTGEIVSIEKKKENKNAPLLFNLAELQNECSKLFKISPDETLAITQELYEKKLVTYPRTDARVLSTAVAKEINRNIGGLKGFSPVAAFAQEVLDNGSYKGIAKTRYVNDKQITDHYAIIPTGQGLGNFNSLKPVAKKVYELICRRFLSIFYPPAVYRRISIVTKIGEEKFFAGFKVLMEEGWFKVAGKKGRQDNGNNESGNSTADTGIGENGKTGANNGNPENSNAGANPGNSGSLNMGENTGTAGKGSTSPVPEKTEDQDSDDAAKKNENDDEQEIGADGLEAVEKLKKGDKLDVKNFGIKTGETSAPKRYNSGSLILAMENAGQLIEDEELRSQIKGSGIGTSATRAEILSKLVRISYLALNKKTQIITPTLQGEMIYEVVDASLRQLLNPELTASWEKGLTYVANGEITEGDYMVKLEKFVSDRTNAVKQIRNAGAIRPRFEEAKKYYK